MHDDAIFSTCSLGLMDMSKLVWSEWKPLLILLHMKISGMTVTMSLWQFSQPLHQAARWDTMAVFSVFCIKLQGGVSWHEILHSWYMNPILSVL